MTDQKKIKYRTYHWMLMYTANWLVPKCIYIVLQYIGYFLFMMFSTRVHDLRIIKTFLITVKYNLNIINLLGCFWIVNAYYFFNTEHTKIHDLATLVSPLRVCLLSLIVHTYKVLPTFKDYIKILLYSSNMKQSKLNMSSTTTYSIHILYRYTNTQR